MEGTQEQMSDVMESTGYKRQNIEGIRVFILPDYRRKPGIDATYMKGTGVHRSSGCKYYLCGGYSSGDSTRIKRVPAYGVYPGIEGARVQLLPGHKEYTGNYDIRVWRVPEYRRQPVIAVKGIRFCGHIFFGGWREGQAFSQKSSTNKNLRLLSCKVSKFMSYITYVIHNFLIADRAQNL